ncbi:MAG: sugar porter family MFS transporter, partial [Rhodospirillales bacterium]|nr:sugar porter family MFS transporter [Rhodospirillales bacterium]
MGGTNGFKAITIVAGLGGLLFGYDTGVISGALLYIRNSFQLSSNLQGLVVAVTLAGAAIGAAIIGPIADRFGRRIVLLAIALVFVGGALLCASAWSFEVLVTGRFVLGLAIGVASMLTPLYLSEIADASRRGGIVTLNQLFITLGLFLSFLVDFALAYFGQGSGHGGSLTWRLMLGAAAVPGALLFAGMLVLPESPRWLLGRGKADAAEAALRRLRPGMDPAREFDEIRQDISKTDHADGGWGAVFSARVRMPLVVGVGLAIFQQITGINTVIYFAPTVFTDSGIATATGAILVT